MIQSELDAFRATVLGVKHDITLVLCQVAGKTLTFSRKSHWADSDVVEITLSDIPFLARAHIINNRTFFFSLDNVALRHAAALLATFGEYDKAVFNDKPTFRRYICNRIYNRGISAEDAAAFFWLFDQDPGAIACSRQALAGQSPEGLPGC